MRSVKPAFRRLHAGYGGGLSLADGYKLDKTVLTEKELLAILAGVRSIDSVFEKQLRTNADRKILQWQNHIGRAGSILIDLASWYQNSLPDKIERIRLAIRNHENIAFVYYSEKGESERMIEPYRILFQWSAWYVYGYCPAQGAFRLFRFNRFGNCETPIPFSSRDRFRMKRRPLRVISRRKRSN